MLGRRARCSPIGVELTPDRIRLLQVEDQGGAARVLAFAEVKCRSFVAGDELLTDALAQQLRQTLRDNGFRGSRAVVGLPPDELILRHVKVDVAEGKGLADALLFELEDAFPSDTPIVQHIAVGEVMERGERKHEFVLLAAALGTVEQLLTFLEKAGLDVVALDIAGCALIRCFMAQRRRASDTEAHSAIIHLGDTVTLMTITAADRPLFMKQLPIGTLQMMETLRLRLDLDADDVEVMMQSEEDSIEMAPQVQGALRGQIDALALELAACLRYHAASRRSTGSLELVLTGRGALLPGFADAIADALGQSVNRPDPFAPGLTGVRSSGRLLRDYAAWSVPLGLALRNAS